MTLELEKELYQVVEFQHVKPGKGHAFVRTKLRGLQNGVVVDRTFRAGEKVERAIIDKRSMQLLYRDGNDYVFMDSESFEQLSIEPKTLGDSVNYLAEQSEAQMLMFGSEIVGVVLFPLEARDGFHDVGVPELVESAAPAAEVGDRPEGVEHLDLLAVGEVESAVAAPLTAGG